MAEETEAGSVEELAGESAPDVQDTDDGGAIVKLGQDSQVAEEEEFYSNIADALDQDELDSLCTELRQESEDDTGPRRQRDAQDEEVLRRTGLGDDAPGGAGFQGES